MRPSVTSLLPEKRTVLNLQMLLICASGKRFIWSIFAVLMTLYNYGHTVYTTAPTFGGVVSSFPVADFENYPYMLKHCFYCISL